jgi:hypothetical protein
MQPDGRYVQRSTDGLAAEQPEALGTHNRLMLLTLEAQSHAERHRHGEF